MLMVEDHMPVRVVKPTVLASLSRVLTLKYGMGCSPTTEQGASCAATMPV